jgi:hypothetical protein
VNRAVADPADLGQPSEYLILEMEKLVGNPVVCESQRMRPVAATKSELIRMDSPTQLAHVIQRHPRRQFVSQPLSVSCGEPGIYRSLFAASHPKHLCRRTHKITGGAERATALTTRPSRLNKRDIAPSMFIAWFAG